MELKELSSNWKKLQKTLQKERTGSSKQNLLKRKSVYESPAHDQRNGVKKRKIPSHHTTAPKRQKMGASSEKTTETPLPKPSVTLALFAEDNDIPAADLVSAYSLPTPSSTLPSQNVKDVVNGGLSATAVAGKYIALDCEMVGIGPTPDTDSQLARVSIVNYHGQQLYDSYVLPQVPVTDYRTAISGITPSCLKHGRPFAEVQRDVAELMKDRILVGHAIKHDLAILMLGHPKRDIRDTSRHPAYRALSAGRTPGLKKLAKEVLGVEIQGGEHSSIEDARATVLLFRKEKEAFEAEHARRWGRAKAKAEDAAGADGADKTTMDVRGKRKKKSKK